MTTAPTGEVTTAVAATVDCVCANAAAEAGETTVAAASDVTTTAPAAAAPAA